MARFKSETMTQCKMNSATEPGTSTVGWIESCFAHVNNLLVDEDGEHWVVAETFATQPTQYILDHERDYKKQRAGSDI